MVAAVGRLVVVVVVVDGCGCCVVEAAMAWRWGRGGDATTWAVAAVECGAVVVGCGWATGGAVFVVLVPKSARCGGAPAFSASFGSDIGLNGKW